MNCVRDFFSAAHWLIVIALTGLACGAGPALASSGAACAPSVYSCLTLPGEPAPQEGAISAMSQPSGVYRFRMAVAATAEFTTLFGGKDQTWQALVTIVERVNRILRPETGIQLDLIGGFETMIFTDAASDPYTVTEQEPSMALVDEAQRAFDSKLGSTAYDVGMVFTRGTYGLAYIKSVCDPHRKGASAVGFQQAVIDDFHVNLVAHELAHQFGANHTFNSPTGLCAQRRTSESAYEPGAGSTIMSYAGLPCADDVFQAVSDAYFHSENLKEIVAFLTSASASCGVKEPVNNTLPFVNAGTQFVIPANTPYTLTASANDPDGDVLLYSWEERDLGPARRLNDADDGLGPLVRSAPPSSSPSRTIPNLADLAANRVNPAEQLPTVNRTMKFRVTVRDSGAPGAATWADTSITVVNQALAFQVTSHATPSLLSGSTTLRWDVARTTGAPISVSNVKLSMSTDGGLSFPIVLVGSTPNDGMEVVNIPAVRSQTVRFKVEALNNIFFAINRANQSVGDVNALVAQISATSNAVNISWPSTVNRTYLLQQSIGGDPTKWETIRTLQATSGETVVTLPLDDERSTFFRVIEQ